MLSITSPPPYSSLSDRSFGSLLKGWRTARRFAQLALAEQANISQRHLSFLETGRASPSREMVIRLAQVLDVPLRERNELLRAGGFAPMYRETALDDVAMAEIRAALKTTLEHHEPYPALVVNRQWDLILHNRAMGRLISLLGDPTVVWEAVDPTGRRNLMRLTLHPMGLQPMIEDWPATAASILARLEAEAQANPANTELRTLLTDLYRLPGVPPAGAADSEKTMDVPVLAFRLSAGGASLALFSMMCTFGKALDLTADELRLELMFPSDASSAAFLREAVEAS